MVKFVGKSVVVQVVGINSNVKEMLLFKRKKISHVIVKKVNVLKNIVNALLMELSVAKDAIVKTVKIFDIIIYILLLYDKISSSNSQKIFN